jgi:hypothetical protein
MASAADALLEPECHGIAGEPAARAREVGGRRAVELPQGADARGAQPFRLASGLIDERVELVPVGTAFANEVF